MKENKDRRRRKVAQAPWRKQLQGYSMLLIFAVGLVIAVLIYLSLESQTNALGRDIIQIQADIHDTTEAIEDKTTLLAELTSIEQMAMRATEMGFNPAPIHTLKFLEVEKYPGRPVMELEAYEEPSIESEYKMNPAYTLSLLDWVTSFLDELMNQPGL